MVHSFYILLFICFTFLSQIMAQSTEEFSSESPVSSSQSFDDIGNDEGDFVGNTDDLAKVMQSNGYGIYITDFSEPVQDALKSAWQKIQRNEWTDMSRAELEKEVDEVNWSALETDLDQLISWMKFRVQSK